MKSSSRHQQASMPKKIKYFSVSAVAKKNFDKKMSSHLTPYELYDNTKSRRYYFI
jgi:hypothetical protein